MPVVSDYTALLSDSYWSSGGGVPTVITYSFSMGAQQAVIDRESTAFVNSFSAFTAQQETMTQNALDIWAAASGIIFVEVGAGNGDMEFGNFDLNLSANGAGASGYAYYPGRNLTDTYASESDIGGDVFINTGGMSNASDLYLILHEIGHALGLEHPHEGDVTLDPSLDDRTSTVLSYNWANVPDLGTMDHEAMEVIYGGPAWTPSTTGGLTAFNWNGTSILTQTWGTADSDIMGSSFRDVVAAGAGADLIGGFGGGDRIDAGDGNDIVWGGDGRDRLAGDNGNDDLNGQDGNDFLYGGSGDDEMSGDDGSDAMFGGDGADTLYGGAGYDTVVGGDAADYLYSGDGDDLLSGGLGDDWLQAGSGSDLARGNGGLDTIFGGAGHDELYGEAGNDYIDGGTGTDEVYGGAGNDNLRGNSGGDLIEGGNGSDIIQGEDGTDSLLGGNGIDSMYGGDGNDYLSGDNGNDNMYGGTGRDLVYGGSGNDRLRGDDDADDLFGGNGSDRINGGNGNDLIVGGGGDDTLYGGNNEDVFVFAGVFGDDWIYDFQAGDLIDLSGTAINSFAQWQAATSAPFSNAIETNIGNNSISIFNVAITDFDANDFIF